MKNNRFEKYIYEGVTAVLVIAAAVALVFLFIERKSVAGMGKQLLSILAPIICGAILAFLFSPVYNMGARITSAVSVKLFKSEKGAASAGKIVGTAASLLFLYVIVASLAMMIIPQLHASILGIINTMPVYVQNVYQWLTGLFANNPPLEEAVLSAYQKAVIDFQEWVGSNLILNIENLEKILGGVSVGVMGVFSTAKNLLIGVIVMIYLLNIKETLAAQGKKLIYTFLPLQVANATVEEFRYIHKVFSGFIIGKLIDSLIIGVICFILMNLFRLPYALLISVIVGVTNIIPFFGPFIGAIPSAVLVFLISPKQCLYFIGLILVLQQFDGNILGPKILGNSTGLSSFWVLFSILLFGGIYGFVGMIIAVPLTAVIFDLFGKLQTYLLLKKKLSSETKDYEDLVKIDEDSGKYLKRQ